MRAARHTFGQVGYVQASIETIAREAGVSTRTIYNHFDNKEQLFSAVLLESSTEVAQAREALIERHLGVITDLERDLTELAKEWIRPREEFEDHFAIVRRLRAESERFPDELRLAWRTAGRDRARHALATRFADLERSGMLIVSDHRSAANHFMALIAATAIDESYSSAAELEAEIDAVARSGVRAFLYGHLPR